MYLSYSMKQDKVKRFQWRVIEVVLFLLSQVCLYDRKCCLRKKKILVVTIGTFVVLGKEFSILQDIKIKSVARPFA